MEHVIMKEDIWDDWYPIEAQNTFIKELIEKHIVRNEEYAVLKELLREKLKSLTSLSDLKFEDAFIELFVTELSD